LSLDADYGIVAFLEDLNYLLLQVDVSSLSRSLIDDQSAKKKDANDA
jgi:hypothetical protein